MIRSNVTTLAIVALVASAATLAQNDVDRAFTATGASCDQITWSEETLAKYPQIASACQDVMERDGKYYVKFSGSVRRVADRGRNVTVDFKNGSRLALEPPENMSLYIDGRPKSARALRRGDQLTFYVPQDNLAATPPSPQVALVNATVIPITRIRVAEATPADDAPEAELPSTAGVLLPMIGLGGLLLTSLGALLSARRRLGQ